MTEPADTDHGFLSFGLNPEKTNNLDDADFFFDFKQDKLIDDVKALFEDDFATLFPQDTSSTVAISTTTTTNFDIEQSQVTETEVGEGGAESMSKLRAASFSEELEFQLNSILPETKKSSRVYIVRQSSIVSSSEADSSLSISFEDNSSRIACSFCGKQYNHYSSVYKHINSKHKAKRHTCQTCGKSYSLKHHLRRHMKTHSENG